MSQSNVNVYLIGELSSCERQLKCGLLLIFLFAPGHSQSKQLTGKYQGAMDVYRKLMSNIGNANNKSKSQQQQQLEEVNISNS